MSSQDEEDDIEKDDIDDKRMVISVAAVRTKGMAMRTGVLKRMAMRTGALSAKKTGETTIWVIC